MSISTPITEQTLQLPVEAQAEVIVQAETRADLAAEDLLAQVRWRSTTLLAGAVALVALDVAAGWFYTASFFGYFHLPLEGLGITAQEIVAHGARSLLLPLAVLPVAFVASAPHHQLVRSVPAVGGYILALTYIAFATSFFTTLDLVVQVAAMFTAAAILFCLRRGYGRLSSQRLILLVAALLAFSAVPVAGGLFDAGQKASVTHTTLRLTTRTPLLPGGVVTAGAYTFSDYVLLRENDSRYWVMRLGDHHVYSISKSEVIAIRYW